MGNQVTHFSNKSLANKAYKPMYPPIHSEQDIETAIKILLAAMNFKEKIGQLQQIGYGSSTLTQDIKNKIVNGEVGSFTYLYDVNITNDIQKLAMQQSRLKIPLLSALDVIHGFKTIMPIPLAQASSFNLDLVQEAARVAAIQASSTGVRWTFSPMVDIARDPRWGRIAQGCGEDPYLAGQMGAAMCRGYQTQNMKDITAIAACGKHYVGYGATEGGRDYNTTLIPENTLRDIYLIPFQELSRSGCQSFMSAFNDLNGQPASGNDFVLKQVLRRQWKFDGIVVSDYQSIKQMITHGYCQNQRQAALKGFNGGVDMQMVSTTYFDNLQTLLNNKKVTLQDIDKAVSNCLRVKFRLGLFQNPYTDPSRQSIILDPKHLEISKKLATQSAVLLQNKYNRLPLSKNIASLAVIGPLADDGDNQIGCWGCHGDADDSITPLTSLRKQLPSTKINYSKGIPQIDSTDTSLFQQAIAAAQNSQYVLMFMGQSNLMSGESCCRAFLNLPGVQQQLVQQLSKLGKPTILVIFAGRPLVLTDLVDVVDSIIYNWQLGTMNGPAIVDLLLGTSVPSGKSPVSFVKSLGQIPTYYNKKNTGRPWAKFYIDEDADPLYPFGYGLSYATFKYSNLKLSKGQLKMGQQLLISADILNQSTKYTADETVMLFIRDLVGSYTRPVKQLKAFKKLTFKPLQTRTVTFSISSKDLTFWTKSQKYSAEPGRFDIWIAKNSADETLKASFTLLEQTQFQILQ